MLEGSKTEPTLETLFAGHAHSASFRIKNILRL